MKLRLSSWFFLITLLVLGVMNLLYTPQEEVSRFENRTLQTKPIFSWTAWWSGDYVKDYESYFSDHFVHRSTLIQAGRYVESFGGLPGQQSVSLVLPGANNNMFTAEQSRPQATQADNLVSTQEVASPTEETVDALATMDTLDNLSADEADTDAADDAATAEVAIPEPEAPTEPTPELLQQTDAYLVFEERALQTFSFRAEAADALADTLQEMAARLGPDLTYYSMIVPTQISFYLPKAYNTLSDPQPEAVSYLNSRLSDSYTTIDLFPALAAHQDEYIYFRTDHHWTALGAYYGYEAFMQQLGETPTALEEFETDQVAPFLGSAYSSTLHPRLQSNPDTVQMYFPVTPHSYHIYWNDHLALPRKVVDKRYAAKHGEYAVFLEGDYPWGVIQSKDNKNGKRLAIVKDSYGNAFIPFLIPHFEEIYIIDPRFFKSDFAALVHDKQITEILFLSNITALSHSGYRDLLVDKLLPAAK